MSIPGSYGHYDQDAKTYAAWGMDFVKMVTSDLIYITDFQNFEFS